MLHSLQGSYPSSFHRYKVLKFVDLVSLKNGYSAINASWMMHAFPLFSNHFKRTTSSRSYCTRSVMVWYLRNFTTQFVTVINLLLTQPILKTFFLADICRGERMLFQLYLGIQLPVSNVNLVLPIKYVTLSGCFKKTNKG